MKERKGPFGVMVGGIVDSVVQGARRRAQDREPRALVYGADGRPRLLPHDAPGREELITAAARLIELVGAPAAAEAEAEAETEAGLGAEEVRSVSALEPDPDVVTDAEVITPDAVETTDDVATTDEVVTDADVVAPDDDAPDARP